MRPESSLAKRQLEPLLPIETGEKARGLSNLEHIRAMLFDVYGTLLISHAGEVADSVSPRRRESIYNLLRRFDIAESPEKISQLLEKIIAAEHARLQTRGIDYPEVDILEIWRRILAWGDLPRLKTFAREYEMIVNPVYPMPGLAELLQSCRERGLTMGIISNAQFYTQDFLENMLAKPMGAWGFDPQLILYSYQYQTAKPSARLFKMAAQCLLDLGIQPEASLYVGNDMRNDMLPAKTVGFQTALFAGDQRSLRWRKDDDRCRDLTPDMVVTDLRQLIPSAVSDKV
jgi:putative hydrolase of the HAD superfamily